MVVSAVEKFAQVIPLNLQEIFIWYFEQRGKYDLVSLHCAAPPVVKGVDNPERFLAEVSAGADAVGNNDLTNFPLPTGEGMGEGLNPNMNPENQLSHNLLPQNRDMNTLALLLGIMQQINKEKGDKAKPEDFINVLKDILEQEKNNEVQELQK